MVGISSAGMKQKARNSERLLFAVVSIFAVAAAVADGRDAVVAPAITLGGWRGETVSFRFNPVSVTGGTYVPQWKGVPGGWDAKAGVLRGVRYVTKTHGTEYGFLPDRVEWNGATNLPPGGSCVAVGSISIPRDARAGEYSFAFAGHEVKLRVTDRVLPPPQEWKMRPRAFWHHPWALARVTRTIPWSKEHFEAMRPFLAYTAAFGHRTIMCTMSDLPWNHQCYDPNWTMIRHIRHGGTGKWSFDYSIFDKWVAFNREMGIGPDIDLYSLCPWDYEVTYEDESGRPTRIRPKPGSKEFVDYWEPFLVDLHRHLEEKGWLGDAQLYFDERSPEDVRACVDLIRRVVPDMRVGASGNKAPELFDGVQLGVFVQLLDYADDAFFRKAREMKKLGRRTYVCVCCLPKTPNTFIYSDPDDGFWLGVFPAAKGIDGLSRWTFDSFPENAMEDASYASWPSGETFLVYPDASPSWRYLQLLNGYQNGEKWRMLADAGGPVAAELERLAVRYDVQQALHKKDGDFKGLIADTLEVLNR